MSVTGTALSHSPTLCLPGLPGHPSHHLACCCLVREELLQSRLVDTEEEHSGDDPWMKLLLGPHDLQAPNQPPSSGIALTGPGQPFPPLFLRKLGDYSPNKAWKRSLCSTVRRGGAHCNSGGARSQRADLGTVEIQVRVDWNKKETNRETNTLTYLVFPAFALSSQTLWKGSGRKIPRVSDPHSTPPGLSSTRTPVFHLSVSQLSLSSLTLIFLILQDWS